MPLFHKAYAQEDLNLDERAELFRLQFGYMEAAGRMTLQGEHALDPGEYAEHMYAGKSFNEAVVYVYMSLWCPHEDIWYFLDRWIGRRN